MKIRLFVMALAVSSLLLTPFQSFAQSPYEPYTFTTFAGSAGQIGSTDGTGSAALFYAPARVAADSVGNIYVADVGNLTIRKVTATGVVTTLASVGWLFGVAVDGVGNVYVSDRYTIKKLSQSGVVTTVASGLGGAIAVDSAGNIFVADGGNTDACNTILKVTPTGVVTTLAGLAGGCGSASGSADGTGNVARFSDPGGVAVDGAGNVYVADTGNNTIRKVTPSGVVTTLAGIAGAWGRADGTGSAARFANPSALTVDAAGNVYVADTDNNTIRKVTPQGVVTTIAGLPGAGAADGTGSDARFNQPRGLAVDSGGNLYVADTGNSTIRSGIPAVGPPTLLIQPHPGTVAVTYNFTLTALANGAVPLTYQWRKNGANIVGATGVTYSITNVLPSDAGAYSIVVSNVDGSVISSNAAVEVTVPYTFTTLAGLAPQYDTSGNLISGSADGTGSAAQFRNPNGEAVDSAGNIYVADSFNNTIRKVTPTGVVTTLAGLGPQYDANGNLVAGGPGSTDGTGGDARFSFGCGFVGMAADSSGNIYVADPCNATIRKVTPVGVVTTLAGLNDAQSFGDGTLKYGGGGVAVDAAGNLYVADSENNTIRKVTPKGTNWIVTTLAGLAHYDDTSRGSADGTGSTARFNHPIGVAVDGAGNIYVADSWNATIREVTPAGVVTTLAGQADSPGSADGTGSTARFNHPIGVAVDSAGALYVADSFNSTIRKITPMGTNWVVTTLGGLAGNLGSADGTGSGARFGDYWLCGATEICPMGPSGIAVDGAGNLYVADTANNTIRKGCAQLRILNAESGFGFQSGGSGFGFDLTGLDGRSVVVESSTDLLGWLPIWTNIFSGTLHFNDPQSGGSAKRFYRTRTP